MKTLKKTLCLVLAVIMAVGVLVLPAAAADDDAFTDAAKIKPEYRQAVDVLNLLEVLQGNPDGSFAPQGTLTRAQGVAIAVRIVLKPDAAGDLPRTATGFTDVPAKNWASGVIGYAHEAKIVTGNPDGSFAPEGLLTRDQFAKMLLVAMGINGNYTGTYWQTNVYVKAREAGLLSGLNGVSGNDLLTREEAAQMALNAIYNERAVTVWNDKTQTWEIADGGETQSGKYAPLIKTTFGLMDTNGEDNFLRPTKEWKFKNSDEAVLTVPVVPVKSYDGTFNGNAAKELKLTKDNVELIYNGTKVTSEITFDDNASTGLWINKTTGINGYEVSVYNNPDYRDADGKIVSGEKPYLVVIREAYVAQVGSTAKNGDIKFTVYAPDKTGGKEFTVVDTDDIYESIAAFDEDEYVAVYPGKDWETGSTNDEDLLEVAPLEAETVTIKRIDDNQNKNTLSTVTTTAGRTFNVNQKAVMTKDGSTISAKLMGADKDLSVGVATLYTLNGKILFVDQSSKVESSVVAGYGYMFDFKQVPHTEKDDWASEGGTTGDEKYDFYARILKTDGETLEAKIAVDQTKIESASYKATIKTKGVGELVHYKLGEDDVYTVTPVTGHEAGASNKLEISTNKSEAKLPGASSSHSVAFSGKTVFFVVTTDDDKQNYKVTSSLYNIYDIPNFSDDKGYVAAAKALGDKGVNGGAVSESTTDLASVVLIRDAKKTEVKSTGFHFVVGNPNATKVRLLLDENDASKYIEYYVYNAVIDGKLTTVKVQAGVSDLGTGDGTTAAPSNETNLEGIKFVKDPVVDDNGIITKWGTDLSSASTDETVVATAVTKVVDDHTKLTVSGGQEDYLVSAAFSVAFEYNTDDGSLKEIALKDIEDSNGNHYGVRNDSHTIVYSLFLQASED